MVILEKIAEMVLNYMFEVTNDTRGKKTET